MSIQEIQELEGKENLHHTVKKKGVSSQSNCYDSTVIDTNDKPFFMFSKKKIKTERKYLEKICLVKQLGGAPQKAHFSKDDK